MKTTLKKLVIPALSGLFVLAYCLPAAAKVKIGQPAPDFTLRDAEGNKRSLSEFKDETVVLEWHNKGCPFVKKHYREGDMQSLQKNFTEKGVVWLTIISSAKGKQGYMTGEEARAHFEEVDASPTAVLLDPDGEVGKLYGAKTTPHMYVIDKNGVLQYNGAIDDNPSSDTDDIQGAKNFVAGALNDVMAGKRVANPVTRPYGCSVKYAK